MCSGGEAIMGEDRIFNDAVLEILRIKMGGEVGRVCM